jgi:hypothetical protein
MTELSHLIDTVGAGCPGRFFGMGFECWFSGVLSNPDLFSTDEA